MLEVFNVWAGRQAAISLRIVVSVDKHGRASAAHFYYYEPNVWAGAAPPGTVSAE